MPGEPLPRRFTKTSFEADLAPALRSYRNAALLYDEHPVQHTHGRGITGQVQNRRGEPRHCGYLTVENPNQIVHTKLT